MRAVRGLEAAGAFTGDMVSCVVDFLLQDDIGFPFGSPLKPPEKGYPQNKTRPNGFRVWSFGMRSWEPRLQFVYERKWLTSGCDQKPSLLYPPC